MGGSDFDIYQTDAGYVAVTNDVRRTILAALAKRERQLPELVKITKKAKPTLSSVHMRELLDTRLVEEVPHPTDRRKKIYRIKGRRIGTSNLPVAELRTAVRTYAGTAAATRVPLSVALDALAAAPPSTPDAALRAQARRLGSATAGALAAGASRDAVTALAGLLEREGIARGMRLDLEGLWLELELLAGEDDRIAMLVAALAEGMLAARAGGEARVRLGARHGRRFTLLLG